MEWGELRLKVAQILAVVGLTAMFTIGLASSAGAAPADRPGDAVVLKGNQLGPLVGADPAKIVGFRWAGSWEQIPVQVDERHTISARQLYPPTPTNGYVKPNESFFQTFDIEVYADPKTRSGADQNPAFDADDEFTFMGGDSGGPAPADVDPPAGVDGVSAVKVTANDSVGGGEGFVYLFNSTGSLDPGAGKDYVDYDFKLLNLTGSQTLKDDYGYIHSTNPEDSTVTTANYELHSYDRWMEDELKVKAGNSTGVDILDRETAQAYKNQCGRTQYTFSGRWKEDTWAGNDNDKDDEGTYIAVIDGPVRAIRSYMGANSGPYVQREHIYYSEYETNFVFLRVHIMQDLYTWTDYSTDAIGMTYRDEKNPAGVMVDGNPDTLLPTNEDDVVGGAYSWQQLTGPQGTVSTVVGADTNIEDPQFANYYLDDSTPTAANERQCGGDGQSIGASGFGILGAGGLPITPNTDPRDPGGHRDLTVKRVRYFGPPSDGASEAGKYRDRVAAPLTGSSMSNPIVGGPKPVPAPRLKMTVPGKKSAARKGKIYRLRVKVANSGGSAAKKVKVCVRGAQLAGKGACRLIASVPVNRARTVAVKVKVRPKAKGRQLKLTVRATGPQVKPSLRLNTKVPLRK